MKKNKIKKFLIINTGYFGDVVLTSKLTSDVKKAYPESLLVFIADAPYVNLAKGLPGVDEVFCFDRKKCHNIFEFLKFVKAFPYKFKIDFAFISHSSRMKRFFLVHALFPKKIIRLSKYQKEIEKDDSIDEQSIQNRIAYQIANMLSKLTGKFTDNKDIKYFVPQEEEVIIEKKLEDIGLTENFVAINPQAGDEWKCWDVNEVVKFAQKLINEGKKVILTGVLKDGTEYVKTLNKQIGENNYFNFVGKTSIPELGALYKKCQAVISVDTGSMHLACAVGTPTVALFFRDNFKNWGPLSSKNSCIYNPEGISAETVYNELQKILN